MQKMMSPITITLDALKYKYMKQKLVKMMTNSPCIAGRITRASLRNKGRETNKMPERKTVRSEIRKGLHDQKVLDDSMDIGAIDWCHGERFFDAISGAELNPELVKIARPYGLHLGPYPVWGLLVTARPD